MTYIYYKDHKGEWRWRLKAARGRIIAGSGEGYKNQQDCLDHRSSQEVRQRARRAEQVALRFRLWRFTTGSGETARRLAASSSLLENLLTLMQYWRASAPSRLTRVMIVSNRF